MSIGMEMQNHRNRHPKTRKDSNRSGYVLMSVSAGALVLIGSVGLAVDVGRMYITKGEAQIYADSAALAAVLELDGTSGGLDRAISAVAANPNRNAFGTTAFTGTVVEFATVSSGPWSTNPGAGAGYVFARVNATAAVPLYFLGIAANRTQTNVAASAVAGQVSKTSFGAGLFPFSPYAH